jgi:hypothetical protein
MVLDGLNITYELPVVTRLLTTDPDGNRVHLTEVAEANERCSGPGLEDRPTEVAALPWRRRSRCWIGRCARSSA